MSITLLTFHLFKHNAGTRPKPPVSRIGKFNIFSLNKQMYTISQSTCLGVIFSLIIDQSKMFKMVCSLWQINVNRWRNVTLIVEETDDFGGTLILSNPSDIQNYYFFVSYQIFCLSFFFHSHDSHLYGLNLTQQFVSQKSHAKLPPFHQDSLTFILSILSSAWETVFELITCCRCNYIWHFLIFYCLFHSACVRASFRWLFSAHSWL